MANQAERVANKLYEKFLEEALRGRKPKIQDFLARCPASEADRLRAELTGVQISVAARWSVVSDATVDRAIGILRAQCDRRSALEATRHRLRDAVTKGSVSRPQELLASCLGIAALVQQAMMQPSVRAFARGETGGTKTKIDRFWLKMKEPWITEQVDTLLRDTGIMSAPVDLMLITEHLGLAFEQGDIEGDIEGCMVTDGIVGGILISTKMASARRRRFTWGHEIGHFVLHKDKKVFTDTDETTSYIGGNAVETEANIFGSMLLMPGYLMPKGTLGAAPTLSDGDKLSELFDVSLEASLRRLVRASGWPCALVVSKDGEVLRTVGSDFFSGFVPVKSKVPQLSCAASLADDMAGEQLSDVLPAAVWLGDTSWDGELIHEESRKLREGYLYSVITIGGENEY